ncbi:MAG: radical SAM protein [Candidatus Omnitrophica bacterium]|nr:radical SAM protein [Candidatus Omnitrophota bacterium]
MVRRLVIYLIKPSKYDDEGYVIRHWRGVLPSNTLACLNGLTEDVRDRRVLGDKLQWQIITLDESVQRVNIPAILRTSRRVRTKAIVCLVGVQTNQFPRASDLALELRSAGVDVLIGGFHVSGSIAMLPGVAPEIQRLIDAGVTVVAGEIEGRWGTILRDVLDGSRKPVYNFLGAKPDLSAAPCPDFSRRSNKHYVSPRFGTLDCGRGCPFECSFCTVVNVQGRKMRFRDVSRLVAWIRANYREKGISYYFFTDDNFCRNKYWEEILDALIRLRVEEKMYIAFMMQVDARSHKLPDFVTKAKKAGCSQVFIGLESLNSQNLEGAGKRQNQVGEFREMIESYRREGISTHVAYIIGFPFDTAESVHRDVEQLKLEVRAEQASFFMLTPLPGSEDHLNLLNRGVSVDSDLNRYDTFHATTEHPLMTKEEWTQSYKDAWSSFYSLENMSAILRRVRPESYWGVFGNFVWYKNATMVEGGHPMINGFFRLKNRLERRPGFPVETRWLYLKRRIRDILRYPKLWATLALEMQELWLQTRRRSKLEELIVEELEKQYGRARQWRQLQLTELQLLYRRALVRLGRASGDTTVRTRLRVPSRGLLWLRQRNIFCNSLTYSRHAFRQFRQDTWHALSRGRLHRVDLSKLVFDLLLESWLFLAFLCAFFKHTLVHFFGGIPGSVK